MGQLGYKNCTETCFRESHPIQLRWPCKNPGYGDSFSRLDSKQVSCLAHCIVHANIVVGQNPNNASCFKVCSVYECLFSKLHQKQLKYHEIFGYQQKLFHWVIVVIRLYVLQYCNIPILDARSNKYFQQNGSYHFLSVGERDSDWQLGRYESVFDEQIISWVVFTSV